MSGNVRKFARNFVKTRQKMKQIQSLCLLLAGLLTLAACTGSDDSTVTYNLYGDAVITNFQLGTLKYTDTSKGTYSATSYAFKIDQLNHTIENARVVGSNVEDSYWLPAGTDVTKVVCTISTMNNGTLGIKDLTSGEIVNYSSTDSIDFTQPRTFAVAASDGSGYTEYTVKVNVHTADGDDVQWTQTTDAFPADLSLLGKSTYEEYTVQADGSLAEREIGQTAWTPVTDGKTDDSDDNFLPTKDVALVSYSLFLSDSTDCVLLAGTRVDATGSEQSVLWRKIVDYAGKKPKGQWVYMDREGDDLYQLPVLTGLSIIRYDDLLFAYGGDYKTVYQSRDNGITWRATKLTHMLPTAADGFDIDKVSAIRVVTDADNYIWLRCTMTDSTIQVWRGRLNRLGWD